MAYKKGSVEANIERMDQLLDRNPMRYNDFRQKCEKLNPPIKKGAFTNAINLAYDKKGIWDKDEKGFYFKKGQKTHSEILSDSISNNLIERIDDLKKKEAHAKKIPKKNAPAPASEKPRIPVDKLDAELQGMFVLNRINVTLFHIQKMGLVRRRGRKLDICMDEVQSVKDEICRLRDEGFDLILPSKFFAETAKKKPSRINHPPSYPYLQIEPLRVDVSNNAKERWFFPTTPEWKEYLLAIKKQLQKILRLDIVFNREILGFLLANKFKGAEFAEMAKEIDNLYKNEHKGSRTYGPTSFQEMAKEFLEEMKIEDPELFNKTNFCVAVGSPIPIHRQFGFTEAIPEHAIQIDEMLKIQLKCKEAPPLLCLLSHLVLSLKQDGLIHKKRSGKYYVTDQGIEWVHDFDEDFFHTYFPAKPEPYEKEGSIGRPVLRWKS